jgi:WD40 repeat protein
MKAVREPEDRENLPAAASIARAARSMTGVCGLGIAIWLVVIAVPSAAIAAFPGANGRIAFTAGSPGSDGSSIHTVEPDGSGLTAIGPNRVLSPSWSADGDRIAFTRVPASGAMRVMTMAADGTDVTGVAGAGKATNDFAVTPSFSPSGNRIAYSTSRRIHLIRSNGTDKEAVIKAESSGDARGRVGRPAFSPNGKRIAFIGLPQGERHVGLWTVRPDGSGLKLLTKAGTGGAGLSYSPDGRFLAFGGSGSLLTIRANGADQRLISQDLAFPAWAPAGDRLVGIVRGTLEGSCGGLVTFPPDGSQVTPIPSCSSLGSFQAYDSSWQPVPG